jgi:hypothetical protein
VRADEVKPRPAVPALGVPSKTLSHARRALRARSKATFLKQGGSAGGASGGGGGGSGGNKRLRVSGQGKGEDADGDGGGGSSRPSDKRSRKLG